MELSNQSATLSSAFSRLVTDSLNKLHKTLLTELSAGRLSIALCKRANEMGRFNSRSGVRYQLCYLMTTGCEPRDHGPVRLSNPERQGEEIGRDIRREVALLRKGTEQWVRKYLIRKVSEFGVGEKLLDSGF